MNRERDHANKSITAVGHNTEKSSGVMRILTVIQIPVKYHQLTMV